MWTYFDTFVCDGYSIMSYRWNGIDDGFILNIVITDTYFRMSIGNIV
jgi:hypothetical protein